MRGVSWNDGKGLQLYIYIYIQVKLIKDKINSWLFHLPRKLRNVCSKTGIQGQALVNITKSISLSLSHTHRDTQTLWIRSLYIGDLSLFIALML